VNAVAQLLHRGVVGGDLVGALGPEKRRLDVLALVHLQRGCARGERDALDRVVNQLPECSLQVVDARVLAGRALELDQPLDRAAALRVRAHHLGEQRLLALGIRRRRSRAMRSSTSARELPESAGSRLSWSASARPRSPASSASSAAPCTAGSHFGSSASAPSKRRRASSLSPRPRHSWPISARSCARAGGSSGQRFLGFGKLQRGSHVARTRDHPPQAGERRRVLRLHAQQLFVASARLGTSPMRSP